MALPTDPGEIDAADEGQQQQSSSARITRRIGAQPIVPSAPSDAEPLAAAAVPLSAATQPSATLERPEPVPPQVPAIATGTNPNVIARNFGALQDYQGRLDRFNAGQMYAGQQEEKAQINRDTRVALKGQHVQTEVDPDTGLVQPVRDETGKVQFQPGKGPVQYDDTGHAVQRQWDTIGPKDVALDANAEIGAHPDRPAELYRQNKYSPWDYLGTVDKGLKSKDAGVRKAAEGAQVDLDKQLHGAGHDALSQEIYSSAENLKAVQAAAAGKQNDLTNLRAQAADLEGKVGQTEGGIFGIGKHPTGEAAAAKTKLDEINGKIDALTQAGYGKTVKGGGLAEPPDVTAARKAHAALTSDRAAWGAVNPKEPGQLNAMIDQRRATILNSGGDPDQDRVIQAIEAKKKELGITAAQAVQQNAQDEQLRSDPTFGPLLQERDALQADHQKAADALNQISAGYEEKLAPIRDELSRGQAAMEPLQKTVDAYTQRLETLVGMPPVEQGEDPQVRQDEVSRRISALTDPRKKAQVNTVLNALEPATDQLRSAQNDLAPIAQAHDALQEEGANAVSQQQSQFESELAPRRDALNQKFEEAQNAREQQNWDAIAAPVLERATKRAMAEQEISKDWSGNEPPGLYHTTDDGKITFERGYTAPAMIRAYHDGALSPDWLREHLADARKADNEYQELMAAAGANPKLKAFIDTGIKSYLAFQGGAAASAAVAPFDPELAAAGAPVGGWGAVALPALVHGIAFLGGTFITKKATDVLLKKASDYSNLVKSLETSAQLQPGYAAAGEFAGMGPAAVSSFTGFTKAASFIAEKEGANAAVKFVATKLASGAGAGAVFEAALRPGFDAATHALGIDQSEFHYPTFTSVAQAALIMSVLSGDGLSETFKRAANLSRGAGPETAELVKDEVANIKKNGASPEARAFFGGIDPEVVGTTHEKVAAYAASLGMQYRPLPKPDTSTPESAGETTATQAPTEAPKGREPVTAPTVQDAHSEIDGLQMEGKTPEEHAVTQNALRGLVKVGQGQPIESLTSAERTALLQKGPDGIARVEMVKGPNGSKPVITDGALDRVAQIAPVTRQLLPPSEEGQRQSILSNKPQLIPNKPAEIAEKPSVIPQNQPTFAVEVQNAKGETRVVHVAAADEQAAHAQVAQQIPAGTGLVRDVTKIFEPPTEPAPAPKNFVDTVVKSAAENKGGELTPEENKQATVVAKVLQPHYERWSKAFAAVNAVMGSNETGGLAFTGDRQLAISVKDVISHAAFYKNTPQHAANLMLHEAAHSVTTVAAPEEIMRLWKDAPASLRSAMKKFYKANDSDYALAHEYWSYFLAGQAELASGNRIRLAGKFLPEQSSRKFVVENRKALARVLRFVRNAEGELSRAGKSAEYVAQWKALEKLFTAKLKEVDAHARPASKEVTPSEKAPQATVPVEHPARGPPGNSPAGNVEPKGIERAGAGLGTTGGTRGGSGAGTAAPKTPGRTVEPDTGEKLNEQKEISETGETGRSAGAERSGLTPTSSRAREQIAASLGGIVRGSVGSTSRLTQNGRTVNVTYVAQEAAAARPSHDITGRATPGYDKALQPRDRALPQYRKQSQNIANDLDFSKSAFFPDTKTPATTADIGVPVMTRGGDTLIGNGREIGIKAAYDQGLTSGRQYKADFVRNAHAFGIDPAAVMAMKQPILKRVLLDDLSRDELVRLSQESNEGAAMASNATEIAGRDASRITPELLSLFDPNFALDAARNTGFLRAYARDVIRAEGANETNLNPSELARRIRAAVFTYAYGADEAGRAALQRLAGDESDAGGKNITNALMTVAPIVARMKTDIASGDLHPLDISPAVSRAVQDISEALRNRPKGQSGEVSLKGLLGQRDLLREDPLTRAVTEFLVENRTKRAAIEEALSNYVEAVFRVGSPKEGQLFGETKAPSVTELWQRSTTADALAPKTEKRALAAQRLNESLKAQPLQTFKSRDDAFASAERAKPTFDRTLEEIARVTGGRAVLAPIKSVARASAKVASDYNGDWSQIKDLVRGTIVVRDDAQARKVVAALAARFGAEPKRDFGKPLPTGYRDALFNPVIDGHASEVQVHLEPVIAAKQVAHPFYERQQTIERAAKLENRTLNAQELRLHDRLRLAQRRIYEATTGDASAFAGISSTASEGLQGKAPLASSSALATGRGAAPLSNIQAEPSAPTTTAQAPSGALASGTSMKDLAFGNRAAASSSVIAPAYTRGGEIGQRLSAQQLDLFSNYAATLPAAAKASKPAMKSEVAKDVPALSDNDAALDDLMALAQPKARQDLSRQKTSGGVEAEKQAGSSPIRPTGAVITDFGEKIGGARKDLAASMKREISDADIVRLPLSEIWPKSEVDAIEDIPLAALATAVRDEIPSKPRQAYKVQRWAEKVGMVRGLMRVAAEQGYDAVIKKMADYRLEQLANKIRLLQSVPRDQWGRIGRVEDHPDAYRYQHDADGKLVFENGQMAKIPAPFASAEVDGRSVGATNLSELTDKVSAKLSSEAPTERMQFEVRGREGRGWGINKKGDPLHRKLKTFEDSKEALDFARNPENYGALTAAWDAVKQSDNVKETDVRRETNRDRSGKDWRDGRDATPEMFMESLGFRGAEFGNWVSQGKNIKERQGMLNAAYDALHDLAEVVGIPPKAISLNGTLGLGFGSRGHGWASAHYEPDKLVINLTKTRGAGSLAHEWFHALDNYFQRQRNESGITGRSGDYITNNPETYYESPTGQRLSETRFNTLASRPYNAERMKDWKRVEGVRPQVAQAFSELVKTLDDSPMAKRAALIDAGKSGGYWSRVIERAARSFENYVIAKMQLDGTSNDYLANVTSVEDFARDKGRYPYLLPDEIAPVSKAFDNLFSTLETKPTEKGVALHAQPTKVSSGSLVNKGEEENAGGITSTAGVGLRGQGTGLGEKTSLRQQGEITGTGEPQTEPERLAAQPITEKEQKLFEQGLPLATQIARRFNNIRGVDPKDVRQHAQIALSRAARAYDPAKGAFMSFARTAVNNELRGLYRTGERSREDTTLDQLTSGEGEGTQKDLVAGPEDVRSNVQLDEGRRILNETVAQLPERMQGAIGGILNGDTLEAIGADLGGISRQAVGRLATEAMRRLRGKLGERGIKSAGDLLAQKLDILDAHIADTLKAQAASDDPIEQLMASLDKDHLEELFDKASAEERGKYTIGRPDLALGAEGPSQRAVDQYYTDLWKPKTRETMAKEADQILSAKGLSGFANEIAARWLNGDTLRDSEVMAAKTALAELSRDTSTKEGLQRMFAAGYAYRNIRGQTARDLAAGFDPHKTPEERNREFLAKTISTLPKAKEAEIEAETDPVKRRALLDAAMKERLEQLEKAFAYLSKGGLTLEDIMSGGWELHGKGQEFLQNEMAGFDVPHQQAIKLSQTGARTAAEIAKATGLTPSEVERTVDQFVDQLRNKLRAKVAAGLTVEKIDMQGALLAQKGEAAGGAEPTLSDEAINRELDKIIKGFGFVAAKDLGKFKVVTRKRSKLFVPPAKGGPPVEAPSASGLPYPPGQVAPYTGRVLGQIGLPLYQEMMVRKGADLGNTDEAVKLARVAQAINGNRADMIYEAWIQSILSGPTTHIAYKMALAANTAFEFTVQRGTEALVNLLYRDKGSATFGEFKHIRAALLPAVMNGISIGARQWSTESDIFEQDIMNSQAEMFDRGQVPAIGTFHKPSISETPLEQFFGAPAAPLEAQLQKLGQFNPVRGRVIRMPTRLLWFIDGFYKTTNAQLGVTGIAYRMARREGLTGEALASRMQQIIATPGGPAWIKAGELARWLALRERVKTTAQGGNFIDNAVAKIANARNGSHLIGSQLPFIQLPYSFLKIGLGKAFAPVVTAAKFGRAATGTIPKLGYDPSRGFFKMKDGKPLFDSYPKAQQVRDIASSFIALATGALIWRIMAGDGDDDSKFVLVTGSVPYSQMKKGVRDLQQRAYGGPYVLRIGGRKGITFNFGKYEPGATVLGTLADTLINAKHLLKGELGPKEAMDGLAGYLLAQTEEKTFLRGIANIDKVMKGEMGISEFAGRFFLNALVPNLVRQPLRNMDDYLPDAKHSDLMYSLLPAAQFRQPKIDVYGKPVAKTGNWFTRMFTIAAAKPYPELEKADRLLLHWNNGHPRDVHAPVAPSTTYVDLRGQTQQMAPQQSTRYQIAAGKRFQQMLRGQITQRMIDHPTEENVKLIENLHREAVDQIKREMFPKGSTPPAPVKTSGVNLIRAWKEAA